MDRSSSTMRIFAIFSHPRQFDDELTRDLFLMSPVMGPPWACTIPYMMANPRPVPAAKPVQRLEYFLARSLRLSS